MTTVDQMTSDQLPVVTTDICRPQTHGEEELQLQLALAMSREEAEAEDSKKKSDDMRLQMAIQKSRENPEGTKVCVCLTSSVSPELD